MFKKMKLTEAATLLTSGETVCPGRYSSHETTLCRKSGHLARLERARVCLHDLCSLHIRSRQAAACKPGSYPHSLQTLSLSLSLLSLSLSLSLFSLSLSLSLLRELHTVGKSLVCRLQLERETSCAVCRTRRRRGRSLGRAGLNLSRS